MTTPDTTTTLDTSLRAALRRLDAAGRLAKISRPVAAHLEVAALMKHHDGGPALLFERVERHDMPVLGNFLASPANCEAAFALDAAGIRSLVERGLTQPVPPVEVAEAPCQEVRHGGACDLGAALPVLWHAPGDAGRFVTAGVVVVRDPETGVYNASYHRLQLLGGNRTAVKLDHGRHLRAAHEAAARAGEDLPVAVCIGTDLALLYAAAFMGAQMPRATSELDAAGGIKAAGLAVAACLTQDLVVPAETEIVLEGTISATETVTEGPFAEFVGYPSEVGPSPVLTVTALTTRRDPVYYAINGAGRETVMLRKYVLEASLLRSLRAAVPIVTDVEMTAGGLHRFHAVVAVRKESAQHEGFQRNAILAAFAALKDLDHVTVVDDDVDIRDPADVEYAVATRMEASRDLLLVPGARGHEYVRVSDGGVRAKLGIDATVPFANRERFRRAPFAAVGDGAGDLSTTPGSARAVPWLAV